MKICLISEVSLFSLEKSTNKKIKELEKFFKILDVNFSTLVKSTDIVTYISMITYGDE